MKKITLIICLVLLGVAGLQAQTNHFVEIVDFAFDPETLAVNEGDTVTWINLGSMVHTSTSGLDCTKNNMWDSEDLEPDDSFSFVFTTSGSFPYFCIPHCAGGMTGLVTVSGSTGIAEVPTTSVHLNPQPAKDHLQITLKGINREAEVTILDITGKIISRTTVTGFANIDLSNQPAGVYVYLLQQDGFVERGRFLKE